MVSNSNGVNSNRDIPCYYRRDRVVSNSNGVNSNINHLSNNSASTAFQTPTE